MLILDDGSFTIGNTFALLYDADEYHTLRQTESWISEDVTEDAKNAAMIRAFDYLRTRDWQAGIFDVEIPSRIIQAQYVAAAKELSSPGTLQSDVNPNVKRKRIEGAIDTEYFSKNLSSSTVFTEVDNLIKPYLNSTTNFSQTSRTLVRM